MKTFEQYVEEKVSEDLAYTLVSYDIDVDQFCEAILELASNNQLNEETLLNELGWRNILGGASNLAAGVAGLGGLGRFAKSKADAALDAGAGMADRGVEGLNRAGSAVGSALGRAGSAAWDKTGGALGRGAKALGQGAMARGQELASKGKEMGSNIAAGAASQWGQAKQHMAQGSQAEKLRQAQNAVMSLRKQLSSYGFPPELLDKGLQPLMNAIQHDTEQNQAQLGYKMGGAPLSRYGVRKPRM